MRISRLLICVFAVAAVFTGGCVQQETEVFSFVFEKRHAPARGRAGLTLPRDVLKRVAKEAKLGERLGYTQEQMAHFASDKFCLGIVKRLFRDVASVPDYSGRIARALMAYSKNPGLVARVSYILMDVRAGAGVEPPADDDWGLDAITDGATPAEALEALLVEEADETSIAEFKQLPTSQQKLFVRLLIASVVSAPFVRKAFDLDQLADAVMAKDITTVPSRELYSLATGPWETSNCPRESFEIMDELDLAYLSFSAVMYHKYVSAALAEYGEKNLPKIARLFGRLDFNTLAGPVSICDTSNSEIADNRALVLDLGGSDSYTGITAVPRNLANPISTVVDLGGDDRYVNEDDKAAIACGLFGMGSIYDLAGDDLYHNEESGIGSAWRYRSRDGLRRKRQVSHRLLMEPGRRSLRSGHPHRP
ncbi:MAG: hypothetical protein U5N86_07145 [Planctomycetota bacterium]|nr:hypothetical protein [Planctomycetota bacterium]